MSINRRQFVLGLASLYFLGASSLMATNSKINFPRGLSSPFFTDDQDKSLRKILNWFKTAELLPAVDLAELIYVKDDRSDETNYPNEVTFTSSPGSVAVGRNESVDVENSQDVILVGNNSDITIDECFDSTFSNVNGLIETIQNLDRVHLSGLFNHNGPRSLADIRAPVNLDNKGQRVDLHLTTAPNNEPSYKITAPLFGNVTEIYNSTGTRAEAAGGWVQIGVIRLDNSLSDTSPTFHFSAETKVVATLIGGTGSPDLGTAIINTTFVGFSNNTSPTFQVTNATTTVVSPVGGTDFTPTLLNFDGVKGSTSLDLKIEKVVDGDVITLVISAQAFYPSGDDADLEYTLNPASQRIQINGEVNAFIVQHGL